MAKKKSTQPKKASPVAPISPEVETLRTEIKTKTADATRIEEAIRNANLELLEILEERTYASRFPEDGPTVVPGDEFGAAAEAAAAEAKMFSEEADTAITAAFDAGIISYKDLPSDIKENINEAAGDEGQAALMAAMALLSSVGVEGLLGQVEEIRKLYPKISSEDALLLLKYDKRFNEPYLKRFEGNKIRMQKGLPPLDDVDYIADEQAYEKIFKTYDLKQFANRSYYATLIGDNQPPADVSSKVSLAYNNILNGPKENLQALTKFFKINDIVAYALSPDTMVPIMKQKIQAAQIGGVALQQGLGTSLEATTFTGAEAAGVPTNIQRGTIGVTAMMQAGADVESAREAASYVAGILPVGEKLSSIYANGYKQYGQLEAEKEKYLLSAEARAAREALKGREIAEFSGEPGVLKSQRRATGGLY